MHRDVFKLLLLNCKLESDVINTIWQLTGPSQGALNRTSIYKTLALIAWAQQGKIPSQKLFDNFNGNGNS